MKSIKLETKLPGTKVIFNIVESTEYKAFQVMLNRRLVLLTPLDGSVKEYQDGNIRTYLIYDENNILKYIFTTNIVLKEGIVEFKIGEVIEVDKERD